MGRVMTPDFTLTINGTDLTKLCIMWQLDDIEDGISTLTAVIGNPDGQLSGYLKTETEITLRYGYWNGKMSKPVTMKIKDKEECSYTGAPCTITVVGMDCTERLTGTTFAGSTKVDPKIIETIESLFKSGKIKGKVELEEPKKGPEKIPLHNMTAHAGIRWIMGMATCKKQSAQGGSGGSSGGGAAGGAAGAAMGAAAGGGTPIRGQEPGKLQGNFPKADSVMGDRVKGALNAIRSEIEENQMNQKEKAAANTTIYGHLECVGIPGLEAKKCVTIENVGAEGSGKWYVKKSSQRWNVNGGYHTLCELMRATLGKDGKPIEQPIVAYANIYEKDSATVKCRDIDGESQYTFVFGQPEENSDEMLMQFRWGIRLQKGRGVGEHAKSVAIQFNKAPKLEEKETKPEGKPSGSSSAPMPNIDSMVG